METNNNVAKDKLNHMSQVATIIGCGLSALPIILPFVMPFLQRAVEKREVIVAIFLGIAMGTLGRDIRSAIRKYRNGEKYSKKEIGHYIVICLFLSFIIYAFDVNNGDAKVLYNNESADVYYDTEEPNIMNNNKLTNIDTKASICDDDKKENYQKLDIEEDSEEILMTLEQTLVDYYVKECTDKVLPKEVWEGLSSKELYYIRNGICAYMGRIYESGYYNIFHWYNGTINSDDFNCSILNVYQYENIVNIRDVENSKKLSE